jgi:hypothetical protein
LRSSSLVTAVRRTRSLIVVHIVRSNARRVDVRPREAMAICARPWGSRGRTSSALRCLASPPLAPTTIDRPATGAPAAEAVAALTMCHGRRSVIASVATAKHASMIAAFALDARATLVVRALQIAYPVKVRASAWQPDVGGIIL